MKRIGISNGIRHPAARVSSSTARATSSTARAISSTASAALLVASVALSAVGVTRAAPPTPPPEEKPNFDTSLHATRVGKAYWYGAARDGFEKWTGVPIEKMGCVACHGPHDADGKAYAKPYPGAACVDCHASEDHAVSEAQCLGCHGRQKTERKLLPAADVHIAAGMLCWDCHGDEDMHGDGTAYASMLEPGAIKADCANCHAANELPARHAKYDPHEGKLHCTACHSASVISCYNCHLESQVQAHVKRANRPLVDFVMLVNREKDGKVHTASFQSLTYEGNAFVAFGPYTAHATTKTGRGCADCHANKVTADSSAASTGSNNATAGPNEAIAQYNETGSIRFTTWNADERALEWIHGVVPIPEDYAQTLKMEFLTFDGDPATPAGEDKQNWSSIKKDTWDGSQLFFASPLTREQMDKLGFNAGKGAAQPAAVTNARAE